MKILVFNQFFLEKNEAGGSRFNHFAKCWTDLGHEVTIISGMVNYLSGKKKEKYRGKFIVKEEHHKNINVFRCFVSENHKRNFFWRVLNYFSFVISSIFAGLFYAGKQDIVIASSPSLLIAIPGYIVSRLRGIPLIFEVRDLWPKFAIDLGFLKNKFLIRMAEWLEGVVYKKSELIIVLTPAFKEYLISEKKIDKKKIFYVPNGADFSIMSPASKTNWVRKKYFKNKFVVLLAGSHNVIDDLGQIVNAAKLLKDNSNILFVFIGDGAEKNKLVKEALKHKLNNVLFLDPVAKDKLADYINAADVCVVVAHPVLNKIYLYKGFDYMSCGKPIIISLDGASKKLIVNEAKSGKFVEPRNVNEFKKAVLYFYNHGREMKIMGENGYKFVKKNFDMDKLANQYIKIIGNFSNKNGN